MKLAIAPTTAPAAPRSTAETWATKNLGRHHLAHREVSHFVPQVFVRLLQMQRHRIMDPRADIRFRQMLNRALAVRHPRDIQMVDTLGPVGLVGRQARRLLLREQIAVTLRNLRRLAFQSPGGRVSRAGFRLYGIQPAVIPFDVVIVLARLPMVAQHADSLGQARIVRGHGSGFPQAPRFLPG